MLVFLRDGSEAPQQPPDPLPLSALVGVVSISPSHMMFTALSMSIFLVPIRCYKFRRPSKFHEPLFFLAGGFLLRFPLRGG